MDKPGSSVETEIKLAMPDVPAARKLLRQAGFRVTQRRHFEKNLVFDRPEGDLRQARRLIRVRWAGNKCLLTYKGPPAPGRAHKSRLEIETEVADGASLANILGELGLVPTFQYEKYRTGYRRGGEAGLVVLDETTVGVFLELEGRPEWIDATAGRLGFGPKDYILTSYATLFAAKTERSR